MNIVSELFKLLGLVIFLIGSYFIFCGAFGICWGLLAGGHAVAAGVAVIIIAIIVEVFWMQIMLSIFCSEDKKEE